MIATDLLALLPIITLTCVILIVMMVIAFARNLALTCLCSSAGLALTLAAIACHRRLLHLSSGIQLPRRAG